MHTIDSIQVPHSVKKLYVLFISPSSITYLILHFHPPKLALQLSLHSNSHPRATNNEVTEEGNQAVRGSDRRDGFGSVAEGWGLDFEAARASATAGTLEFAALAFDIGFLWGKGGMLERMFVRLEGDGMKASWVGDLGDVTGLSHAWDSPRSAILAMTTKRAEKKKNTPFLYAAQSQNVSLPPSHSSVL